MPLAGDFQGSPGAQAPVERLPCQAQLPGGGNTRVVTTAVAANAWLAWIALVWVATNED